MSIHAIQFAFARPEIRGRPGHAAFLQFPLHFSINPITLKGTS